MVVFHYLSIPFMFPALFFPGRIKEGRDMQCTLSARGRRCFTALDVRQPDQFPKCKRGRRGDVQMKGRLKFVVSCPCGDHSSCVSSHRDFCSKQRQRSHAERSLVLNELADARISQPDVRRLKLLDRTWGGWEAQHVSAAARRLLASVPRLLPEPLVVFPGHFHPRHLRGLLPSPGEQQRAARRSQPIMARRGRRWLVDG